MFLIVPILGLTWAYLSIISLPYGRISIPNCCECSFAAISYDADPLGTGQLDPSSSLEFKKGLVRLDQGQVGIENLGDLRGTWPR